MEAIDRNFNSVKNRGGSALILVVVLTVLLALIGAMFILMSRIDEMATKSIKTDRQLEAAVETIVDKISEVLVEDIYGTGISPFRFDPADPGSNEPWDYPSPDTPTTKGDPWLACLEPAIFDIQSAAGLDVDQIGFRRITDLYGQIEAMFLAGAIDGVPPINPSDPVQDFVSPWNLRAIILKAGIEIKAGDKADPDGDGVSDGRWFVVPNMTTDKGEAIYAAVRIIDPGGMINVNTAFRNPHLISAPGNWDGSQLSHINLEGITDPDLLSRYDAALIQGMRYGTVAGTPGYLNPYDYINDIEYEANVARRLNDPRVVAPGEVYLPFDIGDELELRNRFFLTTSFRKIGTESRLYADGDPLGSPQAFWRITFNPQAHPGKGLPVGTDPSDPADTFAAWYEKVGPAGIGSSNRRHYSTAINYERGPDRVYDAVKAANHTPPVFYPDSYTDYPVSMDATPLNEEQKIGITLPLEIRNGTASKAVRENFIKRLAMGIYRGLPEDTIIESRFGTDTSKAPSEPFYTREQLAWQMAVNMVDYQDDKIDVATGNDLPEEPTSIELGDTTYYGTEDLETLKKNTICISKIGYKDDGSAKYYGIEVFNPDDDNTPAGSSTAGSKDDLSDYKIIITDKQGDYKGEFSLSGNVKDSGSTDGADDTLAFVFNDSGKSDIDTWNQLNAVSTRATFLLTPPVSDIAKNDKLIVFNKKLNMPVDCVTVPSIFSDGLTVRRRVILPGTNFLLPAVSSASPWEPSTLPNIQFGEKLGAVLDPVPDGGAPEAELIEPSGSSDSDVQELEFVGVQLDGANQQLSNVGEIENVLAVGTRYKYDEGTDPVDKTDDVIECMTFIQGIAESLVAVTGAGGGSYDPTADEDGGAQMYSFGRISLKDPLYWGLVDSLTYFDPARDGVDLHNIAEGKTVTVSGPVIDPTSDLPSVVTDGLFRTEGDKVLLPSTTGKVYWTTPATYIEIDLGGVYDVWGLIVQADFDEECYLVEYWNTVTLAYEPLWEILNDFGTGMLTRPNAYDDGQWHILGIPVSTDKIRISVIPDYDGDGISAGDGIYLVSEVQVGVNIGPYEPYLYDDGIAGRININTAPWYVINQLPWLEDLSAAPAVDPGSLAQAVVAFRDKSATPGGAVDYSVGRANVTDIDIADISEEPGFTNIAQLMQVINQDSSLVDFDIRKNIFDGADAVDGDYTPDTAIDDFEERNLLFHRISNLVTVRSDVFTAYILVRIGTDGPQRRMIAIFDRSQVNSANDKPKLLAIHPVPDPR
ncbi:MAG: hypothetical protein FVQ82_01645 [Planctomycetes bacterium]|nr:hypothetical protein [Planctomycetota bacterium]